MRLPAPVLSVATAVALMVLEAAPAAARGDIASTRFPSLLVRVLDTQTKLPVVGAEVLVSFEEGDPDHPIFTGVVYDAPTNGGGHAFFHGLQGGSYVISVRADGFVSFGDAGHGDRLPTGLHVVIGTFTVGGGASGNVPVHALIRLVPLCADCRVTS